MACIYRLSESFSISGVDPKVAETFVFSGVLSGLIGARIWYLIEEYSIIKDDFWGAVFSGAGFTFYGGFVLAILVLILLCKFKKIPLHVFFDSVGPTLAIGYAIGRLGCQLSGDGDYGIVTNSFLGMSYSSGVVPTPPGVLVYPTPLFESFMAILIAVYLIKAEKLVKWSTPYKRWGLYLCLVCAERFFIEFIRVKERYAFGLSEAHYFSILFFGLGLYLVLRSNSANTSPVE